MVRFPSGKLHKNKWKATQEISIPIHRSDQTKLNQIKVIYINVAHHTATEVYLRCSAALQTWSTICKYLCWGLVRHVTYLMIMLHIARALYPIIYLVLTDHLFIHLVLVLADVDSFVNCCGLSFFLIIIMRHWHQRLIHSFHHIPK